MIINFKLLILKIKLFLLRATGNITRNIPTVELKQQGHNSKETLFIFPENEPEYRVALYSFKSLIDSSSNLLIYFIMDNKFKEIQMIKNNNTIFVDYKRNMMRQLTGFDSKKIISKEFDIIVDLNTNFHYNCSRLISKISSNIKIGFRTSLSDLFYNIQLDVSNSDVIENGYKRIQSMVSST